MAADTGQGKRPARPDRAPDNFRGLGKPLVRTAVPAGSRLSARAIICSPMDERIQRRISANESAFRDVNEATERGLWQGEADSLVAFRCECATLDCARVVKLAPKEYEHVRSDPRRFFVLPGHEIPEAEVVVESSDRYVVVEKVAEAGAMA
jgi:hypothetical protein